MNAQKNSGIFLTLIALTGCTAFQTAGEFQRGRTALLGGMPAAATTYFQQVAALDRQLPLFNTPGRYLDLPRPRLLRSQELYRSPKRPRAGADCRQQR